MHVDSCYLFVPIAAEDEEMGPEGKKSRSGISSAIITELTDCNTTLSQQRKKRQVQFISELLNIRLIVNFRFWSCFHIIYFDFPSRYHQHWPLWMLWRDTPS